MYIDGFNFYFGAVKGTMSKWVDFEALSRLLVPKMRSVESVTSRQRLPSDIPATRRQITRACCFAPSEANPSIDVVFGHFRSASKWRPLDDRVLPVNELISPELQPHDDAERLWAESKERRTEPFSAARIIHREEKGSDVNLAVRLLWDSLRDDTCDKALVITNDSD